MKRSHNSILKAGIGVILLTVLVILLAPPRKTFKVSVELKNNPSSSTTNSGNIIISDGTSNTTITNTNSANFPASNGSTINLSSNTYDTLSIKLDDVSHLSAMRITLYKNNYIDATINGIATTLGTKADVTISCPKCTQTKVKSGAAYIISEQVDSLAYGEYKYSGKNQSVKIIPMTNGPDDRATIDIAFDDSGTRPIDHLRRYMRRLFPWN